MKKIITVVSIFAFLALGTSAFATDGWFGGDVSTTIKVTTNNNANVTTVASSDADTGHNDANATAGRNGGPRGIALLSEGGDGYGHGSNGGRAMGGTIVTGDAAAATGVLLDVNSTRTDISALGCGCDLEGGDMTTWIRVRNNNNANVTTVASSEADTGHNDANAYAGRGGRAMGGMIMTGNADSLTTVGALVNATWTTIR